MSHESVREWLGTVQNGVIVPDSDQPLPEGTRVKILVEAAPPSPRANTLCERLMKLAGTVDDLPTDMARNHDHYIHGTPRR